MKRIKTLSTIAMVLMAPMLIYYPYEALSWLLDITFLDWGKWTRNDRWVYPYAEIPLTTRIVFFVIWLVPTLLGWLAYLTGFLLLLQLRAGRVFHDRIAGKLVAMGLLIFGSATTSLLAGAVSPMIRSWHNPEGPLPLRFWYDSGNLGLAFSGLAFFFLGMILREAIAIARENEAFV